MCQAKHLGSFILAVSLLLPTSAAIAHDVVGQENVGSTLNGITPRASAGLGAPTQNQVFTAYGIYVTVSSDSKHYVALTGPANQNVSEIFWNMKVKYGSSTLDYNAHSFSNGHTWTLDGMGEAKRPANCSGGIPLGTGNHTASAEAWIDQGTGTVTNATATPHTHNFTIQRP